jgi:hypothetical protein
VSWHHAAFSSNCSSLGSIDHVQCALVVAIHSLSFIVCTNSTLRGCKVGQKALSRSLARGLLMAVHLLCLQVNSIQKPLKTLVPDLPQHWLTSETGVKCLAGLYVRLNVRARSTSGGQAC